MNNPYDTFGELRAKIDSNDPFMKGGHQIILPRTDDKKRVPDWALDDKKFREMLDRAFPHAYGPEARSWDRRHAARWIQIRNLYFKVHLTRGQVVEEMKEHWPKLTAKAVDRVIERMRRVAAGLSANGRLRRKRGGARPGAGRNVGYKKNQINCRVIRTSNEHH